MTNKHLGKVDSAEPSGQSCPICESPILKIIQNGQAWWACDCAAMEDFEGREILLSDSGFHKSIRELWGEEILYLMRTRPHLFSPDSAPSSIDL